MACTTSHVANYIRAIIRLKMINGYRNLGSFIPLCQYEETNDVFLIDDLVQPDETLMASAIFYCHQLVNDRFPQNDRL